MAVPLPTTPKMYLVTPKKPRTARIPRAPSDRFVAPTTPRSYPQTPKSAGKTHSVPSTPECFNAVTIETPKLKEKCDQVSNLTVGIRIRPMNARELMCVGANNVVKVRDQELIIRSNSLGNSAMSLDHIFQYDHIFWSCDEALSLYSSQEDVFLTLGKPLLNSAFRGYNACLFAYGQTGSGKSFSMMGQNTCANIDIDSEEYSGITPRFCRDLFDRIAKLPPDSTASVEVSYFEIYNEKIHDLLSSNCTKTPLKVREHPEFGPHVVDLSVHVCKSYKELRNWLLIGNKNRATAATAMNEKSSRSHSIFSIELCLTGGAIDSNNSRRSKVSLVDLAGSERIATSHNTEEKIRQGVSINKSLLTLGKVISALADQKRNQFVPYRESVLTWLLKESLGGNSFTCMLATITPANTHLEETLATLRYACQARSIVNRARVNENPHDRLIRELKLEVQRLRALQKDYDRTSSLLNSSSRLSNSSFEMDDLRAKLHETEDRLFCAQDEWQKKFIESTNLQMKELAESEKRREELESQVRVMNTIETNLDVSLYETNFLEELADVLTEEPQEYVDKFITWCTANKLDCVRSLEGLEIVDQVLGTQTTILVKDYAKLSGVQNFREFLNNLTWTKVKTKKLNKSEIASSLQQIYQTLHSLQPANEDNNLNLLFAKVNTSLQSFEAALLHSVQRNGHKTVTFNL